jgi:hypothetical protein
MPGNGRGRLSGEQAASNTPSPATGFAVDSKPAKLTPVDALDDIAQHVDGTFVLVVKASAERAARNALEAGHNAEVFLAELKPLWKLKGGERR